MTDPVINIDPEIMSGAPVFRGTRVTRVTINTLFDYLENGKSIEDFLEGFPSVKREQVISLLKQAKNILTSEEKLTSI